MNLIYLEIVRKESRPNEYSFFISIDNENGRWEHWEVLCRAYIQQGRSQDFWFGGRGGLISDEVGTNIF